MHRAIPLCTPKSCPLGSHTVVSSKDTSTFVRIQLRRHPRGSTTKARPRDPPSPPPNPQREKPRYSETVSRQDRVPFLTTDPSCATGDGTVGFCSSSFLASAAAFTVRSRPSRCLTSSDWTRQLFSHAVLTGPAVERQPPPPPLYKPLFCECVLIRHVSLADPEERHPTYLPSLPSPPYSPASSSTSTGSGMCSRRWRCSLLWDDRTICRNCAVSGKEENRVSSRVLLLFSDSFQKQGLAYVRVVCLARRAVVGRLVGALPSSSSPGGGPERWSPCESREGCGVHRFLLGKRENSLLERPDARRRETVC